MSVLLLYSVNTCFTCSFTSQSLVQNTKRFALAPNSLTVRRTLSMAWTVVQREHKQTVLPYLAAALEPNSKLD